MGTSNWIGNSTTNRGITIGGADFSSYWYGVTFRVSGSSADILTLSNTNHCAIHDSCYFWIANTGGGERLRCTGSTTAWCILSNCTIRFGSTGQYISSLGTCRLLNCTLSSAGSVPTNLVNQTSSGGTLEFIGCDISHSTGNLVADIGGPFKIYFDRCKLGTGVVVLVSQTTNPTLASPEVFVLDSAIGDGQVTADTGIKLTASVAALSWKIVTSSLCNAMQPFKTPFIDLYNTGTSAVTPYLEIARDGSTTAYTDSQMWLEIQAKTTSGFALATSYSDRVTSLATYAANSGSNQAAGAGTGSWTGLSGTAWSGKLALGSSITPAEVGSMSARVVVRQPSTTVYVDPFIRT